MEGSRVDAFPMEAKAGLKKGAERRRKNVRQDAPSTKLKRGSKFEGNRYSSTVRFALLDLDWGDASQPASQPARGGERGSSRGGDREKRTGALTLLYRQRIIPGAHLAPMYYIQYFASKRTLLYLSFFSLLSLSLLSSWPADERHANRGEILDRLSILKYEPHLLLYIQSFIR